MIDSPWSPSQGLLGHEWLETNLRANSADQVADMERAYFDAIVGDPNTDLVLFGAGNLGRRTLAGLRRVGIEPVAFADNSARLQGALIDQKEVLSAATAAEKYGQRAAFVITVWSPSREHEIANISQALRDCGIRKPVSFVPLFWRHAQEFLPYLCLELPHRIFDDAEAVRRAYTHLADARSQQEFLLQLSYLLSTMDTLDLPRAGGGGSYFPSDLVRLSPDEVFVDCGAYDGDTLGSFLQATGGSFANAIAFEPDPQAFVKLRDFVESQASLARGRIELDQMALGAAPGYLRFDGDGTPGSRLSESGAVTVECVTLDVALRGRAPTFIKMDIEGAEEDALIGAAETIRAHRPTLAVCVYHRQSDLHRIPLLIHELTSNYSHFLRRQGDDGDLVLFAIPNERLHH